MAFSLPSDRSGYGSLLCHFLVEQLPRVTQYIHAHVISLLFPHAPQYKIGRMALTYYFRGIWDARSDKQQILGKLNGYSSWEVVE